MAQQSQAKKYIPEDEIPNLIKELEKKMKEAAAKLEFEKAAEYRDRIAELRKTFLGIKKEGEHETAKPPDVTSLISYRGKRAGRRKRRKSWMSP